MDFKVLEDYEYRKRTEHILKAIEDVAPLIANDKYGCLKLELWLILNAHFC